MAKHEFFECIWEVTHKDINGNIKWHTEKRNALADEGEKSLLNTYFRNLEIPTEFFIRLCCDSLSETDTLSDIQNEPSANGYAAQLIERNNIGFPTIELNEGDWRIISKEFTFTASGGSIGPVNVAYLATTSDNTGKLISYLGLGIERTILDGDSLTGTLKIKLK